MTENLCILNHVILSRLISISTLNMRKQDLGGRGVNEDNDGAVGGVRGGVEPWDLAVLSTAQLCLLWESRWRD